MTFHATSDSHERNSDSSDLEHRVRRSLGVNAPGHSQRRRFAQDGDVPVVIRGRREVDRDAVAAQVQVEHAARQEAERLLTAAQATIRDLQTKLAHTEMALTESRDAVRHSEERVKDLEAALAEKAVVEMAEQPKVKDGAARVTAETSRGSNPRKERSKPVAKLQVGRPVSVFTVNQEPVDWWSKHEKRT